MKHTKVHAEHQPAGKRPDVLLSDSDIFIIPEQIEMEGIKADMNAERNRLPEVLARIPDAYFGTAKEKGTLVNLFYDTYESFTYDRKDRILQKRAVVYLPEGYRGDHPCSVLYLMHGGWSDETVYLGSPETGDGPFKNVLDHAIQAGEINPLIVVCPTYNNTSPKDSGDYEKAIALTDNYHRELMHDLIPAVAEHFHTFAESGSPEDIAASRDHRAFMGFSMGSVATWRTFQYDLDAFRYFFPSSGNLGLSGPEMAALVKQQGYGPKDFFIFAASGTRDFAYPAFRAQIASMAAASNGTFVFADNEKDGNLYFLQKAGARHDGSAAMTYFYNALRWVWRDDSGQKKDEKGDQQ